MRILRIIARLNIGGPAIQAILLSGSAIEQRYRSMLVCGQISPGEGDMSYLAQENDVKPVIVPELSREIFPLNDFFCFIALRRIIRKCHPLIVHTHTSKAGTLGRLAVFSINFARANYRKIKTVHTFHGHVFHSYFGRFKSIIFRLIERWLAKGTDRIVVLSSSQMRDIESKFRIASPNKIRIVPLGFNLSPFKERDNSRHKIRSQILPSKDLFCLGMIGRLTAIKNNYLLLEAVSKLKRRNILKGFHFVIIGDGELRQELEEKAFAMRITDHITFIGWQSNLPQFYSALDGVVLTSRNEGTPVALIEAMAAGKPIISTRVGGVEDLLGSKMIKKNENFIFAPRGILIPSGDADALVRAMVYLRENKKTIIPMVTSARNFVMKNFSKERLINDICSMYKELM
jgi:glycosyltransferase involved in cell wall biosynthesis